MASILNNNIPHSGGIAAKKAKEKNQSNIMNLREQ